MDNQGMDNKFKFITVAAARCNQLQRGARPKVETRSHKNATIAQEEVRKGLIEFRIPEDLKEEVSPSVDTVARGQDAG
jgi:DNA-directed RNA polymerase omega subunit